MKNILLLVFEICFLTQILLGEGNEVCPLGEDFDRSYIGFLLPPMDENRNSRRIRISWGNERLEQGDKILLFSHGSVEGFKKIYEFEPTEAFGIRDTGFQIDPAELFSDLPEKNFTARCIKYYVAWIRGVHIRDINCLGIRPTWMADQLHLVENRTLKELFIPGSHDSGAYSPQGALIMDEYLFPFFKTQDFNILQQLLFGIRYLDIRVGYYPGNKVSPWWVNYHTVRMVPLDTVIDQVKTFLSRTDEFVIFNVREFPVGFDDGPIKHKRLFRHMWLKFLNYAVPPEFDWDMPLSVVRSKTFGRLYLCMDLTGTKFITDTERKAIAQYWGDADGANVFYEHLNAAERVEIAENDFTPKVTLAELVPKSYPASENSAINLQERADFINHRITLWYHRDWFDLANIVAVDFLQSSGIVDVAIRANKFRFTKHPETKTSSACTRPYPRFISTVESMMNQPNVAKLLFPYIVNDAPEKIYDFLAFA